MSDVLSPELERLCGLNNVDFGRDKFGNIIISKDNFGTKVEWRLILNQHKPTVHVHHKDDCYFVSDSYYNENIQMIPDCDCPRTIIEANPKALAKYMVEALLEKIRTSEQKAREE